VGTASRKQSIGINGLLSMPLRVSAKAVFTHLLRHRDAVSKKSKNNDRLGMNHAKRSPKPDAIRSRDGPKHTSKFGRSL
jgi:hypothetical protein